MIKKFLSFTSISILACTMVCGQREIPLINPSFEGIPHAGGSGLLADLKGWTDWAVTQFPRESPYDVHGAMTYYWQVTQAPQDGNTFIGLVVRPNDTWESIGQKLPSDLVAGRTYEFRYYACRDLQYNSRTAGSPEPIDFSKAAIVRIWGAQRGGQNEELLAQSEAIENADWQEFSFTFVPNESYSYLIIEAFYSNGGLAPYAGHVLIDNAKLVELK
jgi:hypothetical protein